VKGVHAIKAKGVAGDKKLFDRFDSPGKIEGPNSPPCLKMNPMIRTNHDIVRSPVNHTKRIQSKAESGEVIISESVYRRIGNHHGFKVQKSFKTSFKEVLGEMKLYRIMGSKGEKV